LEHIRVVKPSDRSLYDERRDYYGFFPEDSVYSPPTSFDISDIDLIYLADTYGIYKSQRGFDEYERILSKKYEPLQLVYGGITEFEADNLVKYDSLGRATIGEFNILGYPTNTNPSVKKKVENIFRVHFTGIWGKYYTNLDEAPKWIKDLYERQTRSEWKLKDIGIIIVNQPEDSGKSKPSIVILDKNDVESVPILLKKREHSIMNGVKSEVPYYYWFEVLQLEPRTEVLADFNFHCKSSGKAKLDSAGLPINFPAVIGSGVHLRNFYFAGDFADNKVPTFLSRYWGIEWFLSVAASLDPADDQTRFYWDFYVPMMKNIISYVEEEKVRR
jgi:hypothetical protein